MVWKTCLRLAWARRMRPADSISHRAFIREDQRFHPFALCFGPGLESFELGIQVRLLSLFAHPAIEDQEPPIEFAHQPLDLRTRHANFPAYRHGLIRHALIHRRTVIGCSPNSWAAAPTRKSLCSRLVIVSFLGDLLISL